MAEAEDWTEMSKSVIVENHGRAETSPPTKPPISNKDSKFMNFETRIEELLKTYFASAFTLLVYRRGLCPKEAFRIETKVGMEVPWFTNPSSVEYVEEVSKKILFFMKRNVLEGAVLHVVVSKEGKPHTIEKYVFRPSGALVLERHDAADAERSKEVLSSVTKQCGSSLLEIQEDPIIKEITCPWYSRWSVSLGLKKQFLAMCGNTGPRGVFANDPNRAYFPWKKRIRQGKKASKKLHSARKNAVSLTQIQTLKSTPTSPNKEKVIQPQGSPDMFSSEDSDCLDSSAAEESSQSDTVSSSGSWLDSPVPVTPPAVEEDWFTKLSSSEEDCDRDKVDLNEDLNPMYPISSFEVTRGLKLNVYRIDYPFDINKAMIMKSKRSAEKYALLKGFI